MVFEAIAELVAERVEKDVSEITMDSKFQDLGIDSLDTVELLMNLEDKLGIEVELAQLAAIEIPVCIIATVVAIVFYVIKDRKMIQKYYK